MVGRGSCAMQEQLVLGDTHIWVLVKPRLAPRRNFGDVG